MCRPYSKNIFRHFIKIIERSHIHSVFLCNTTHTSCFWMLVNGCTFEAANDNIYVEVVISKNKKKDNHSNKEKILR
jgi:hypothetical protein